MLTAKYLKEHLIISIGYNAILYPKDKPGISLDHASETQFLCVQSIGSKDDLNNSIVVQVHGSFFNSEFL